MTGRSPFLPCWTSAQPLIVWTTTFYCPGCSPALVRKALSWHGSHHSSPTELSTSHLVVSCRRRLLYFSASLRDQFWVRCCSCITQPRYLTSPLLSVSLVNLTLMTLRCISAHQWPRLNQLQLVLLNVSSTLIAGCHRTDSNSSHSFHSAHPQLSSANCDQSGNCFWWLVNRGSTYCVHLLIRFFPTSPTEVNQMISHYWGDSCSTPGFHCLQTGLLQFPSGWCCGSISPAPPVNAECGSPSAIWGSTSWPHHPCSWNPPLTASSEEDHLQDCGTGVEVPPQYSSSLPGWPVASAQGPQHLRSASSGMLLVPRTRTTISQRSFTINGSMTWNWLPASLRSSDMTLQTFRHQLKTFLFQHWHCWNNRFLQHRPAPLWLLQWLGAGHICSDSTQLNSTPSKVIDFGTNWKGVCDLLLVINSNYRDMATYWLKIENFSYPTLI